MATEVTSADSQPDEAAQLRQECERLERENRSLVAELDELGEEMVYLKRQLEALKRQLFGQSRSEHVSEAQLNLTLEAMEREDAEQAAVPKEVIGYTRRKPKPEEAQTRLPEELETVTEEIIPAEV